MREGKMVKIVDINDIKHLIRDREEQIIQRIEEGFIAYSEGQCVIPPVGELSFTSPPGDAHIKYGYLMNDDYYVIKIASIFYENKKIGLRPNNGMMLLFKQKTGEPVCFLLDEGLLTQVRTAAAGAVVAKYLAPKNVAKIGVFGAGIQAIMQLEYLKSITPCREAVAWGINRDELQNYEYIMSQKGFNVVTTLDPKKVMDNCNLIVTATPAKRPYLKKEFLKKGVHITAMGSDTPEKQELDPEVLGAADIVVADSIAQSRTRGEIHHALDSNTLSTDDLVELGQLISDPKLRRSADNQITIADLTGVAVQDIQISKMVYETAVSD
jgi:ornithine cyclodeaminase